MEVKWEIIRVGVDFKLKCQGCEHIVTLPREKALKNYKNREKRLRIGFLVFFIYYENDIDFI